MSRHTKPYFVLYKMFVPATNADGVKADTRKQGWAQNGLDSVERFEISDRISKRQLREAFLIIDMIDQKVVKESSGLDRLMVLNHYNARYANDMAAGIADWLAIKEAEKEAEESCSEK